MNTDRTSIVEFGGFSFDTERRLLVDGDDRLIDLTPKAADILYVLVTNAGGLVTKEDLIAAVWPDSFVEEANLSHHVFKLRKALGEDKGNKFIETIPKRGYRFVAEIDRFDRSADAEAETPVPVIRDRPRFVFISIGLAVAALAIGAVGLWFFAQKQASSEQPQSLAAIRSIAVIPFANESGAEDVEYLADGMTETLISSLTQIATIGVKPRSLVARYKGSDVSAVTAAAELNVQAVLFGRITRRGDQITLFLSLIDPSTEFQIWGKQYNRKLADLAVLQAEIGRDVVQSLEAKITGADETRLQKTYSQNAEAYRLYLLGDYHWAKFTEKNFWIAKKHYEDALAIDPDYALAYTGLSNTYSVLGVNGHFDSEQARAGSRAAAEKAIQLDDQLPEARVSLGAYKLFFEWDLAGAEREFRRAADLRESYAVPHELLAYVYRAQLNHEVAIAEAKRSTQLDPLHLLMLGDLGTCYRFAGDSRKAVEINQQVMQMDPAFGDTYLENALALSQLGDHEAAIEQAKKAVDLSGGTKVEAGLGVVYAKAGNRTEAEKTISKLLKKGETSYVSPLDIALVYSALNEKDKAFEWLEKAYVARTPWLFEINVDPVLEPLRDDPRFKDLARRVLRE